MGDFFHVEYFNVEWLAGNYFNAEWVHLNGAGGFFCVESNGRAIEWSCNHYFKEWSHDGLGGFFRIWKSLLCGIVR